VYVLAARACVDVFIFRTLEVIQNNGRILITRVYCRLHSEIIKCIQAYRNILQGKL